MFLDLLWLVQATDTAVRLVSFGLWIAGCVAALRQRPRPGTALVAVGFGLLALMDIWALVVYVAVLLQVRVTGIGFSDVTTLVLNGLWSSARIAGIALVVAGVTRAWSQNSVSQLPYEPFVVEMHDSPWEKTQ